MGCKLCVPTVTWPVRMELPAVYDDSITFYETVCTLIDNVNKVIENDKSLYEDLTNAFQELYDYVHGTAWEDEIRNWILCNLPCLMTQICKFFVFSIDDKGRVVCSIPNSWTWLNINWDTKFGSDTFGHIRIGW